MYFLTRMQFGKICRLGALLVLTAHQSALAAPPNQIPSGKTEIPQIARAEQSTLLLAQLDDNNKRPPSSAIAVIYPNVGEPYRGIFIKIIEGIEEKARVKVKNYPIESNVDTADLNGQLKRYGAKVVIALGRQGLKTAAGLDRDLTVVVGGVLSVPEADSQNLIGTSFTPDPAVLFARLKSLLPDAKRVIVVYDPQHNESLIRLAREEAKSQGLELLAIPARDLASAARFYESTFATLDNRRDTVWLPHDPTTVEENTILPLILKLSWNSSVPIFSSNFLHVKKGALFALYPNNIELGKTLAHSALGILAGESRKKGVTPLKELHTAVNLRTASHIGLNISNQQQLTFDFVFPER